LKDAFFSNYGIFEDKIHKSTGVNVEIDKEKTKDRELFKVNHD